MKFESYFQSKTQRRHVISFQSGGNGANLNHMLLTQNGQMFVRFASDPNERASIIRCKNDLNLKP